MPGFLDTSAVSIPAEYARYLDPDILGKILLKNFAMNVLGIREKDIRIPISRQGDEGNYKDLCDAGIRIGGRSYSIETKLSRQIMSAKSRRTADPAARWNFSKLKRSSASGAERCDYEILFAVGILGPGLEDSREYWKYLHALRKRELAAGRPFDYSTWPHDAAFLTRCGFYIMPRREIRRNQMDITIRKIPHGKSDEFFGWGHDFARLRGLWDRATRAANASLVAG
ncbi:MAG: hypothetical protein ABIT76_08265 [Chthoniobacterales bacterium]